MKKKNSGITLIALVITVILLLILVGISINAAVGMDGIISRAQKAEEETEIAKEDEEYKLENMLNTIDKYTSKPSEDLEINREPILDETIAIFGADVYGTSYYYYTIYHGIYPVQIANMGEVTQINFYIKLENESDKKYEPVTVYDATISGKGALIGPTMSPIATAFAYIGFPINDLNTRYTLKVEYVFEDGSIKYNTATTPDGLCFVAGTKVLTEKRIDKYRRNNSRNKSIFKKF